MKMKSLYIAAVIVMAAAVTTVGKDEPRSAGLAVVAVKGSEVFKVIYRGESSSKVKLNVYNSSSKLVFSETLNGNEGFIRPLNFAGLEFGEYTIELVDATGKKVEKINYQPTKSKSIVHLTKLTDSEGKYLLSVAKKTDDVITVRIFDAANNLLHSNTDEVSGDFAKLYNLKHVSGSVTFEVTDSTGNTKIVRF